MSTEPARHLALVTETGEPHPDAPSYGQALNLLGQLEKALAALEDLNAGQAATIRSQSGMIGRLKRELEVADPETHPQHREMGDLIDRWKQATGHPNAKRSKDRYELIRARLKDGYTVSQLGLAIDGLGAFPFVVNGARSATGDASQRHDRLGIALAGGESVEKFAVLGHRARKAL